MDAGLSTRAACFPNRFHIGPTDAGGVFNGQREQCGTRAAGTGGGSFSVSHTGRMCAGWGRGPAAAAACTLGQGDKTAYVPKMERHGLQYPPRPRRRCSGGSSSSSSCSRSRSLSGSSCYESGGGGHCWSRSGLPQARDLHISPRYCQSSPMAIVMECHYQQGQPETSIYAPDTGSHQQLRSLWNATINRGKYPHWLSVSARERGRIGRARPVQVTMGGEAESAGRRRRRFSWLRAVHRQKLLFCTHSGNQHSVSRAAAK